MNVSLEAFLQIADNGSYDEESTSYSYSSYFLNRYDVIQFHHVFSTAIGNCQFTIPLTVDGFVQGEENKIILKIYGYDKLPVSSLNLVKALNSVFDNISVVNDVDDPHVYMEYIIKKKNKIFYNDSELPSDTLISALFSGSTIDITFKEDDHVRLLGMYNHGNDTVWPVRIYACNGIVSIEGGYKPLKFICKDIKNKHLVFKRHGNKIMFRLESQWGDILAVDASYFNDKQLGAITHIEMNNVAVEVY